MNEQDLQAREIVRQARPLSSGSRLSAGSGGSVQSATAATATRIVDGGVRRLFIPDFDPLDDAGYYLGDAPVFDSTEGPLP